MSPAESIPDIEPLVSPELAETGWPLFYYVFAAAVLLLVVLLFFGLASWKPGRREKRPEVKKDSREVALDVLHRLKEDHVLLPAHELAARAQPVFGAYVETRRAGRENQLPESAAHELLRLEEECRLLRYSRTPEADGRRKALIESLLQFVREDPFQERDNVESAAHTASA
ncbi:MAG: hypothetical protein AAGJ79_06280 [Verrucomicrobiota bacterium]